jgi:hypothetical protein
MIKKTYYFYFVLLINAHCIVIKKNYPVYEAQQIGYIEETVTFVNTKKEPSIFSWKNTLFSVLGVTALISLGYSAYYQYQNTIKYKKTRTWIKNYFNTCITEKIDLIDDAMAKHQALLDEYKKTIQQKIKNENKNKMLFWSITGIVSAIAAIFIYNYSGISKNDLVWPKPQQTHTSNKINSENITIDNSTNTTIIHNHNSSPAYLSLDNQKINQTGPTEKNTEYLMILFCKKILPILSQSNYFKKQHSLFLEHIEYLENDCPFVNTNNIDSFLLEIILEIITEKLLSKKKNICYTKIN